MATPVAPTLSLEQDLVEIYRNYLGMTLKKWVNDRSSFESVVPRAGIQENQVDTQ